MRFMILSVTEGYYETEVKNISEIIKKRKLVRNNRNGRTRSKRKNIATPVPGVL